MKLSDGFLRKHCRAAVLLSAVCLATGAVAETVVSTAFDYPNDLLPEHTRFDGGVIWDFRTIELALSQLGSYPMDATVRMVAIPDISTDEPDFTVALMGYRGNHRISFDQLIVPTSWYSRLEAAQYNQRGVAPGKQEKSSFTDSSERPTDGPEVLAVKRKINQRINGELHHCEIALDDSLADRAMRLWGRMVDRVHNGDQETMKRFASEGWRDRGFEFHFAVGSRSGQAFFMLAESRPDLLVTSALAMRDYCRTKDVKNLSALASTLDKLEKALPEPK